MKQLLFILIVGFTTSANARPLIVSKKTLGYKNYKGQLSIGYINRGSEVRQLRQDPKDLYMSTKIWIKNPYIPRDRRIRVAWRDNIIWIDGKHLTDPVPKASTKKLKQWFWRYKSAEFEIHPPGTRIRNDILAMMGVNVWGAGTNYILKYLRRKVSEDYIKKAMRNCFDEMVEHWSTRGWTLPEPERLKFCEEFK